MSNMDEPVNIDLEPEHALKVLLGSAPLGSEQESASGDVEAEEDE